MKFIDSYIINQNKTLLSALRQLNDVKDTTKYTLFVCDENKRIIGSLTDGDIRRSLIKYGDLGKPVLEVCNRKFKYFAESSSYISLLENDKKLGVIPILNSEKKIISLIDSNKTKAILPLECMLMAGGRGKRLSPLTDNTPKPMLQLGNKPIIEHNIDRLISFGVKKIYISLLYKGEQIVEYFGDGSQKGINIEYIWEKKPLGTAGSLRLVERFNTEQILLMNSDLFTNINFENLYLKLINSNADFAVASTQYRVDVPFAVFQTNQSLVSSFQEKPSLVYYTNAGVYMMSKEMVKKIPQDTFYDITDLMNKLIQEQSSIVFDPITGYWIDIGSPNDYIRAQEYVKHIRE